MIFMSIRPELKMNDGNKIPVLGLGTWQLTGENCRNVVREALELNYRHIDTAEIYENQSGIGKGMKNFERSKIFLTSKVWMNHLRYEDVITACNRSLKELNTSYLDLYLIHWPNREVPLEETFEALKELVDDGKTKSVGVSNFAINLLKEALDVAEIPITVDQVEFHPYLYRKDLLEFCNKNRIVLTAYSPLGRGILFQDETIKEIADKHRKTPAQICLRWGLQKGVVVIPKSGSEKHLKENFAIFDWNISQDDMKRIDLLDKGESVLNIELPT
jgi:diketogulonate reductase-like aldo/keto reductase